MFERQQKEGYARFFDGIAIISAVSLLAFFFGHNQLSTLELVINIGDTVFCLIIGSLLRKEKWT